LTVVGVAALSLTAGCSTQGSAADPVVRDAGAEQTAPASVGTTVHDNQFIIQAGNSASGAQIQFTWQQDSSSITSGQPFDGVSTNPSGASTNCTINVQAGRQLSDAPAQWFTQQLQGGTAFNPGIGNVGNQPDQLNFAVTGTLTINGTGYGVVLGQGSDGAGDNTWWIGGPGFTGLSPGAVVTPDGAYLLQKTDADVSNDLISVETTFTP